MKRRIAVLNVLNVLNVLLLLLASAGSSAAAADISITAVGNAGVGKSFILNLLIGVRDHFRHACKADRVTDKLEPFVTKVTFGSGQPREVSVLNIPGILDMEPTLLASNKQMFDSAMAATDKQVILSMIGNEGGRPRSEDIYVFQAVHKAYQFSRDSVLFVFNKKPSDADSSYEKRFVELVQKALKWEGGINSVFVDAFDQADAAAWEASRGKLLGAVRGMLPAHHTKRAEVEIDVETVARLKREDEEAEKKRKDALKKQKEEQNAADEKTRRLQDQAQREGNKKSGFEREVGKAVKKIKSVFAFKF